MNKERYTYKTINDKYIVCDKICKGRLFEKEYFINNFLKPYGFIYIIENIENGKVYIGKTIKCPLKRFHQHVYLSSYNNKNKKTHVQRAIYKYGHASFQINILRSCSDKYTLSNMEVFYINKYNSVINGYNMIKDCQIHNPMKNTSLYKIWTKKYGSKIANEKLNEFKEKQRIIGKNRKVPENFNFTGHKHSEAIKRQLSKKKVGKNNPMYNKNPYTIWVEKYGIEEADIRQKSMMEKRLETRKKNKK